MRSDAERFGRHIAACNNASLPAGRLGLRLGGARLGWVAPALAPTLRELGLRQEGDGFDLTDAGQLQPLAEVLGRRGALHLRGEPFDIVASPGGPSLGRIDRGALPCFGLLAAGVHVNGLVERGDGPYLWIGRRAADKALDPGKLDHLIAGGIPAGLSIAETLAKEGDEECSLPPELAASAVPVCTITYSMQRPEGLRRDLLHCHDLVLPPDWTPQPKDGEVAEFNLLPLSQVFETVRDTDDFKFNVNLVLIDLFLRRGLIDPTSADGQRLRTGLAGAV